MNKETSSTDFLLKPKVVSEQEDLSLTCQDFTLTQL